MSDENLKRALVLQANRAEAEFLGCFLENVGGFAVTEALNGLDLIKKLRLEPDLILIDTDMKEDFLRTIEIIRRIPNLASTTIAVVTADQTRLPACQGKGINGYILKPFLPQTFLANVWKLMSSRPAPVKGGDGKTVQKLDLKVDKIDNLPTLPTVYAEVERLCQNPNVDAEDLSRVIEADPPITLKLLKLANSAFFGFTRKISSVKDAVSLLGNQTVKNAVLSISIFNAAQDQKATAGLDRKRFWQHSAGVGSIARLLARKLRIEREDCFTAGILHDVGKVILDGLFSDYYAPALRAAGEQNIPIFQAEQEELGLTHTAMGRELAVSWQIPERLIEGITYHHWPGGADLDPELASLVHVADVLCRNAGVGSGGDDLVPVADEFAFRKLGIDANRILEWEEEMLKEVVKDGTFLRAME